MAKVKVYEKKDKDQWVKVKGLARRNTHVKYESPSTSPIKRYEQG
jgi:hypothetical protein